MKTFKEILQLAEDHIDDYAGRSGAQYLGLYENRFLFLYHYVTEEQRRLNPRYALVSKEGTYCEVTDPDKVYVLELFYVALKKPLKEKISRILKNPDAIHRAETEYISAIIDKNFNYSHLLQNLRGSVQYHFDQTEVYQKLFEAERTGRFLKVVEDGPYQYKITSS